MNPIHSKPNSLTTLQNKQAGNELFARGEYKLAITHYITGVKQLRQGELRGDSKCGNSSDNVATLLGSLHSNISACHMRMYDFEKALKYGLKAKKVRPDWPKATYRVVSALCGLRRFAEANEMISSSSSNALSDVSDDLAALHIDTRLRNYKLAICEKEKGNEFFKTQDYHKAYECYLRATRMFEWDPVLFSNLASAAMGVGDMTFAIDSALRALSLTALTDQMRAKILNKLGRAFIKLNIAHYHSAGASALKQAAEFDVSFKQDYDRCDKKRANIQEKAITARHIGMEAPYWTVRQIANVPGFSYLYAFGNTPRIDFLRECDIKGQHRGKDDGLIDVLMLAAGDIRSLLYTASEHSDLSVRFTLNDYDPILVARDVILLALASFLPFDTDHDVFESAISLSTIWFSLELTAHSRKVLDEMLVDLIAASVSLATWNKSKFSEIVTVPRDSVLSILRDVWMHWQSDKRLTTGEVRANRFARMVFHRQRQIQIGEQDTDVSSLSTCMSEFGVVQSTREGAEANTWTFMGSLNRSVNLEMSDHSLHSDSDGGVNPTLLQPESGEWHVHYWTYPWDGMTLSDRKKAREDGLFLKLNNLDAVRPINDMAAMTIVHTVNLARSWQKSQSFRSRCGVVIDIGDAIDACDAKGIPTEMKYDVIDSSNITDHIGTLPMVLAASPRLKVDGVLYTTTMKWVHPTCSSLVKWYRYCVGDVPTQLLPSLLGVELVTDVEWLDQISPRGEFRTKFGVYNNKGSESTWSWKKTKKPTVSSRQVHEDKSDEIWHALMSITDICVGSEPALYHASKSPVDTTHMHTIGTLFRLLYQLDRNQFITLPYSVSECLDRLLQHKLSKYGYSTIRCDVELLTELSENREALLIESPVVPSLILEAGNPPWVGTIGWLEGRGAGDFFARKMGGVSAMVSAYMCIDPSTTPLGQGFAQSWKACIVSCTDVVSTVKGMKIKMWIPRSMYDVLIKNETCSIVANGGHGTTIGPVELSLCDIVASVNDLGLLPTDTDSKSNSVMHRIGTGHAVDLDILPAWSGPGSDAGLFFSAMLGVQDMKAVMSRGEIDLGLSVSADYMETMKSLWHNYFSGHAICQLCDDKGEGVIGVVCHSAREGPGGIPLLIVSWQLADDPNPSPNLDRIMGRIASGIKSGKSRLVNIKCSAKESKFVHDMLIANSHRCGGVFRGASSKEILKYISFLTPIYGSNK